MTTIGSPPAWLLASRCAAFWDTCATNFRTACSKATCSTRPRRTQDAARSLFGDDRIDYTQALQMHYAGGPPADWQQRYNSAYARARGKPESPRWKAKAKVVLVLLDHHIEEEHSKMFTLIGTHFSPEQRNSMGQRCQHFTAQKNEPAMA